MGIDKPQIAILMAVYEPRMDWLREQLLSLEGQTYPNLKLYIRDDCSPTVPFKKIKDCVAECIQSFPYEIYRNEENLGSNKTFERLTEEAEGEYFAYCDQDDIWLPEKLEILQKEIEDSGAELVCSDMYIINGDGKRIADSITKVRRRHRFRSGTNLAKELLLSNFVTGCTMLVRAKPARTAVPFCPYMVHDHYLALCCAAQGRIQSLPCPLIRYRIHGRNQTGLMARVDSRASYLEVRVRAVRQRMEWLQERMPDQGGTLREAIEQRRQWALAREQNLNGQGGRRIVWKYRRFGLRASLFELFSPWLPERVFLFVVRLAKSNKL